MMTLLAPWALLALAALAVPLYLHYMRRAEREIIEFAALRYLRTRARPRQRRQLREYLLLALRLALLATLAVWLAAAAWRPSAGKAGPPWIAVAPGLDAAQLRSAASTGDGGTSSGSAEADWHWLQDGFPAIAAAGTVPPADTGAPLMSLLRELDARLPAATALTVYVPAHLSALDAERPQLTRPVDWRIVDDAQSVAPQPLALHLQIDRPAAADTASNGAQEVVQALLTAWRSAGYTVDAQDALQAPEAQKIQTADVATTATAVTLPPLSTRIVWLAGPPPPQLQDWLRRGGIALLVGGSDPLASPLQEAPDGAADGLADIGLRSRAVGAGRTYTLAQLPDPQNPAWRDPALALRLAVLLGAPDRGAAAATAVAPLRSAYAAAPPPAASLAPLLALLAAVLFALERLTALLRSRARP